MIYKVCLTYSMQSHWWWRWILEIGVAIDSSENTAPSWMECLLRIFHYAVETSKIQSSSIIRPPHICSSQSVLCLSSPGMTIWKIESSMKWFHCLSSSQSLRMWETPFPSLSKIIRSITTLPSRLCHRLLRGNFNLMIEGSLLTVEAKLRMSPSNQRQGSVINPQARPMITSWIISTDKTYSGKATKKMITICIKVCNQRLGSRVATINLSQ